MSLVGDELRRIRLRARLTLKEASAKMPCSLSFLSQIERGTRSPPWTRLKIYLKALGRQQEFGRLLRLAERGRPVVIRLDGEAPTTADMVLALRDAVHNADLTPAQVASITRTLRGHDGR